MTDQSVIERSANVEFSRLDDAFLAIDSKAGYCYSLNSTARSIWELLRTPTAFADICAALQTKYRVDPGKCQAEVRSLLNELFDAGLIKICN